MFTLGTNYSISVWDELECPKVENSTGKRTEAVRLHFPP